MRDVSKRFSSGGQIGGGAVWWVTGDGLFICGLLWLFSYQRDGHRHAIYLRSHKVFAKAGRWVHFLGFSFPIWFAPEDSRHG